MDKKKTDKLAELLQEICDNIAFRDLFTPEGKPTEHELELEKMCRKTLHLVEPRRLDEIQKKYQGSRQLRYLSYMGPGMVTYTPRAPERIEFSQSASTDDFRGYNFNDVVVDESDYLRELQQIDREYMASFNEMYVDVATMGTGTMRISTDANSTSVTGNDED